MSESKDQLELDAERDEALEQISALLEPVVLFLSIIWLAQLIIELVWEATPLTQTIFWLIWVVFVIDFLIRLIIAPHKLDYLRRNWLTILSLFIPAVRILRLARAARILYAARTARSLQVIRVVSSLNRGIHSIRTHLQAQRFGYFLLLSLIIIPVGAAAMYFFEADASTGGFANYGDALYWTGMMVTTMGSGYWHFWVRNRNTGNFFSRPGERKPTIRG
ncbi:MAG: ion transporter [Anaerolineaceae bacterium]